MNAFQHAQKGTIASDIRKLHGKLHGKLIALFNQSTTEINYIKYLNKLSQMRTVFKCTAFK